MGLRNDIGGQWSSGGMVVRLIMINAGVFLFLRLFDLMFWLSGVEAPNVIHWLKSSSHLPTLIRTPWTVVTYMFTHWDLFHIFFNLLILWFIGRIFEDLLGPRRLLGNYLMGGFMGLALFIISYNLFPPFLEQLKNEKSALRNERHSAIARGMARSMAMRSGRVLTVQEMHDLIDRLFACEMPYYTPGGKPTLVTYGLDELEKRFER